jgi:hypothetical protein
MPSSEGEAVMYLSKVYLIGDLRHFVPFFANFVAFRDVKLVIV